LPDFFPVIAGEFIENSKDAKIEAHYRGSVYAATLTAKAFHFSSRSLT
jgi:hypothetical protein